VSEAVPSGSCASPFSDEDAIVSELLNAAVIDVRHKDVAVRINLTPRGALNCPLPDYGPNT